MVNLPAYSGTTIIALLLADALVLALFFVAAGPIFISGRDAFGRTLRSPSLVMRVVMAVISLGLVAYLGVQIMLFSTFQQYFLDAGAVTTEHVTGTTTFRDGDKTIAYWITTEHHRFGVTPAIYGNIGKGDLIRARYRALDDSLFEIVVVTYANGAPGPGASAAPPDHGPLVLPDNSRAP